MKISLEDKKDRKNAKMWIDAVYLQNQTFHTEKNSRIIVSNMTVFFFLTKVSGPFQGGRVEGNDDMSLFRRERSFFISNGAYKAKNVGLFICVAEK